MTECGDKTEEKPIAFGKVICTICKAECIYAEFIPGFDGGWRGIISVGDFKDKHFECGKDCDCTNRDERECEYPFSNVEVKLVDIHGNRISSSDPMFWNFGRCGGDSIVGTPYEFKHDVKAKKLPSFYYDS